MNCENCKPKRCGECGSIISPSFEEIVQVPYIPNPPSCGCQCHWLVNYTTSCWCNCNGYTVTYGSLNN